VAGWAGLHSIEIKQHGEKKECDGYVSTTTTRKAQNMQREVGTKKKDDFQGVGAEPVKVRRRGGKECDYCPGTGGVDEPEGTPGKIANGLNCGEREGNGSVSKKTMGQSGGHAAAGHAGPRKGQRKR